MLVVPFGRREILGVVTALSDHSEVSEEKLLAPLRAAWTKARPLFRSIWSRWPRWLAEEYCSTLARALCPGAATRGHAPAERAQTAQSPPLAPSTSSSARARPSRPTLTVEQDIALAELRDALASSESQTRLLAGITGSGKTEVYLRIAAETLGAAGKARSCWSPRSRSRRRSSGASSSASATPSPSCTRA